MGKAQPQKELCINGDAAARRMLKASSSEAQVTPYVNQPQNHIMCIHTERDTHAQRVCELEISIVDSVGKAKREVKSYSIFSRINLFSKI